MIYVVTGFPRSGTSMMMRCLEFAGIRPCVNPGRELVMDRRNAGDYKANPYGWYEVAPKQYMEYGFTLTIPEGRSVKIPAIAMPILAAREALVIWMHRDPSEIRASYERTFPTEPFDRQYRNWPHYLHELTRNVRAILDDRKSVTVIDMHYADVVANPQKELACLPIDAQRAAAAVDPSLYRHRAT